MWFIAGIQNTLISYTFNTKWFTTKDNRKYSFKLKSILYLAKVKHSNNDYKNRIICTDIYAALKTQNYPIQDMRFYVKVTCLQ